VLGGDSAATAPMGAAAATENKNRRENAPGVVRLSSAIDVIPSEVHRWSGRSGELVLPWAGRSPQLRRRAETALNTAGGQDI
jgi:hypothetical protein